jgi:Rha family phage regulatory protein
MENLVIQEGKQALTTSLKVAETFGKRHDHVLRDIEKVLEDLNSKPRSAKTLPKFGESSYINSKNMVLKMYTLNFEAFMLLIMGYNGEKALDIKLAYMQAFKEMEEYIRTIGKSLLSTKEIALIHQMLVFFKYLDNCQHVQNLHEEMFIRSFYDYGAQESYEDLVKLFHGMRNKLLGIGNTQKIKELYKQYCLINPQVRYSHNANKFVMMFTMDRYEYVRHAVADFLKIQLCEDSYTLKMAKEAKNVAKEASIELECSNETDLFRQKEENIINLADLKKLATALLAIDDAVGNIEM